MMRKPQVRLSQLQTIDVGAADIAEVQAKAQCKQPYVIGAGSSGGVIMHLADQATPQEVRLKGSPGGKNYIGPAGEPGGGPRDQEIVSFDGRVMILRHVDPEIAGRYGTGVYVRCAPTPGGVAKRGK